MLLKIGLSARLALTCAHILKQTPPCIVQDRCCEAESMPQDWLRGSIFLNDIKSKE